ncbi:MAG: serine hydrolase [Candidatus Marinimicrobia bacterium]|jgi:CubicO group peptidase (beta-lactamase class C family)|nr:serine hydrolase [Candidatus Neomarinimicrobiota bacterium]
MKKIKINSLLILFVISFFISCTETEYYPGKVWRTATPEDQKMDSKLLEAFSERLRSGELGYIDDMLVIRNGYIVFSASYTNNYDSLYAVTNTLPGQYNYFDTDWHPYYQKGDLHTMQSVSKSITSLLIGIAIDDQLLKNENDLILKYFKDYDLTDLDERWSSMTLKHILTMTTGIAWDESTIPYTDPNNSCAGMEKSEGWIQFVLDQPMEAEPGEKYVYNSGATMLLSYIIEKTTGMEVEEYCYQNLFKPLGIEKYYWKRTPKGLADTEGGLYLLPDDIARISYLVLNDGFWKNKQVVSKNWIERSVEPHVNIHYPSERSYRYGYKWWILPHANEENFAISGLGLGGQRPIIFPDHNIVAVFTGWNIYDKPSLDPLLAIDKVLEAVIE